MTALTISDEHAKALYRHLLDGEHEQCAVVFASRSQILGKEPRLIGKEIEFAAAEDYDKQSAVEAELRPSFVARVSKKAKAQDLSLIFVHSHPGNHPPHFSKTDDRGERLLADFLRIRIPDVRHGAVVISGGGWRGRELGTDTPMTLVSVGENRSVLFPTQSDSKDTPINFDRQIRAFGAAGQRALQQLTIGILGVGGTGSVVAEQLAYLGVNNYVLIDPDKIETTNLNRVVGATQSDIGSLKVEVAAQHIKAIAPNANVKTVAGDVTYIKYAKNLLSTDFIFSCTDSHGSRAIVQQIVYQYLIPCVDLGSVISASDNQVTGVHGRIQALSPGLPCLNCSRLIDPEQVRRDMMNEVERKRDPYIIGGTEPTPAVISINSIVASLAVTMFMAIVLGIPSDGRYLLYNAQRPTLRAVSATCQPNCYICSAEGVLGRGDAVELFGRAD